MKLFIFLLCFLSLNAISAPKNPLLVHGEEFAFSFQDPPGWKCDCDGKVAGSIGANVAVWKEIEEFKTAQPLIYMRVNDRGRSAKANLEVDMERGKQQVPDMKFKDYSPPRMKGDVAGKIYQSASGTTEYIVYFYPKDSKRNSMSITMHFDSREATSEELKAFEKMLTSLTWISDKTLKIKK